MCCTGLGHVYTGRLLQGLVLFLLSIVIVPIAALVAGLVSSTAALVGLIGAYLGLLGLWLFAVLDACRLVSRSGESGGHDFQKPFVYVLFAAAGVISPMLSTVYVRQNMLEAFYLPSESMAPTLIRGDHILANKTRWRVENIDRSDVVVFRPPDHRHQRHVKRVIGLPGDRVIILGNAISVNGQLIPEKPGARAPKPGTSQGEHQTGTGAFPKQADADVRELTVAPGMCFVLGDNVANSRDSREYGQVPLGDIIGVAEYVYVPGDSWSRFGTLR
jgi:signal peptidase I